MVTSTLLLALRKQKQVIAVNPDQPGHSENLSQKPNNKLNANCDAVAVAQLAECLPRMYKVLGLSPTPHKTRHDGIGL